MVDKGEQPTHHYRVGTLLSSLPKDYDNFKAAIDATDKATWTWEEMTERLLAHQQASITHAARGTISRRHTDAFTATASSTERVKTCYNCGKAGHVSSDCKSNCKRCSPQQTHASKDCPQRRSKTRTHRGGRGRQQRGSGAGYISAESNQREASWICYDQALVSSTGNDSPINYIDSGCTNHMFSRLQVLSKSFTTEPVVVSTAGNDVLRIKKRGDASISIIDGSGEQAKVNVRDGLICPSLNFNLISVSRLDKLGYQTTFGKGKVQIKLGNEVKAVGKMSASGLYSLSCVVNVTPHSFDPTRDDSHVKHGRCQADVSVHRDSDAIFPAVSEHVLFAASATFGLECRAQQRACGDRSHLRVLRHTTARRRTGERGQID